LRRERRFFCKFLVASHKSFVADYRDVGSPQKDAGRRWAILCAALIISGIMIEEAARFGLSWYWGRSAEISQHIRGAELISGDADAWHYLGQSLQYNFDESDPAEEIAYFLRSAEMDPRSADNWMDLAAAYETNGDVAAAQAAFEKARRDYPISARVAWNYGNFLLRQGRTDEGLKEIRRAILTDPTLTSMAIGDVWRFSPDANLILHGLLPDDASAYWQSLDFFGGIHDAQAGLATWESLMQHTSWWPLELKRTFPFLDELIAEGRDEDAEAVWRQALNASHWPEDPSFGDSVIWNGGFEAEIADGGLDWRIVPTPGALVSPDTSVIHSGARSLRVSFTGGMNLDYMGVHELVPVQPETVYELQAYLRTEGITTESGTCFEVADPLRRQAGNFLTAALTGTNSWTPVRVAVKTLPETHFLDVRLRRIPSRLFDNKLAGTVWVDDVTLIPISGEQKKRAE
jgi:tetratricopeptide repeat protein